MYIHTLVFRNLLLSQYKAVGSGKAGKALALPACPPPQSGKALALPDFPPSEKILY